MKYQFLILVFTLISNSLYSQNDLRIFVGTIYGGNYGRDVNGIYKNDRTMDTERTRGSVGPICRGIVLTVDNSSDSVITNLFPPMWRVNNPNFNPRDLKSIDPITNTSEILSFNFSYGEKSTDYVDFYFDKKENLITLTKHILKFDGTYSLDTVKYYGFTRDQLDNPSNDIEIEGSNWFQPRLVTEQFYNLYHSVFENPYCEKYGGDYRNTLEGNRHRTINSLDKMSELVKFYNEHPILDRDPRTRENLIGLLKQNYSYVGIPENLIKELSKYENINLSFLLQKKVDILYYPTLKRLYWIKRSGKEERTLDRVNQKINISDNVDYDYKLPDTTYRVRYGKNSFTEEKLSFHSVFDSYTVKVESEVIDTVVAGTTNPYVIVSKKEKKIIWLKWKSDYEKKKKKYANKKYYKVYKTNSDWNYILGDAGKYPGVNYLGSFYTIKRFKATVMLNNIKVGTAIVGRKIDGQSLLK